MRKVRTFHTDVRAGPETLIQRTPATDDGDETMSEEPEGESSSEDQLTEVEEQTKSVFTLRKPSAATTGKIVQVYPRPKDSNVRNAAIPTKKIFSSINGGASQASPAGNPQRSPLKERRPPGVPPKLAPVLPTTTPAPVNPVTITAQPSIHPVRPLNSRA